ncbi:Rib/alpha-like domain-containing protein [Limosilactobacillus caccae]|uniref:Rib/alpha-like domain-containing protein n=1 Tax=Limosilactobacillus caccae TaxID=1926284 RepID=UPI00097136B0|nr:Rib/alpha-like domain-containing protein [Limosilactobacillus caccae]
MVGKNNTHLIEKKANQHFTKWSLRKLSIGVASVAIASGFFIYSSLGEQVAYAADDAPAITATSTDTSATSQPASTPATNSTTAAESSAATPASDNPSTSTPADAATITTTPIAGTPTADSSASDASSGATSAESGTMENPIVADAIADGYIKGPTDATNAAYTLSGRAWVVDKGTPATMSNGLQPMPDGTKVYLQWMDTDGLVSPVYMTAIKALGKSDGSQVGPGAYAFDLREGWTDVNGKLHKYHAVGGQYYKLWIPDTKLENGNTLTMIRQAGGFYPGSWINSVTGNNIGQFPLIGTNMQRTGIFMGEIPTGAEVGGESYMTTPKDQWIEDSAGPLKSPALVGAENASGSISGSVWLENGGDKTNSASGPNYNGLLGDTPVADYTVVASMLTDEGAKAYKEQVENLAYSQQATAAKTLLTEHPEYIAATVYGKTDEEGRYTLRFPQDLTWENTYLYMFVLDKNGNLTTNYSAYTSPLFRSPSANNSWATNAVPGYNAIARNSPTWYNVHFATVNNMMVTLDITNHDATSNPAFFGDTANVKLAGKGSEISPLANYIQWTDAKGNKIGEKVDVSLLSDGAKANLTISQDGRSVTINGVTYELKNQIKTGDVFTATLYEGNDTNPVAKDSFAITAKDSAIYNPAYDAKTVAAGKTATTSPFFTDYDGNAVDLPEGVSFTIAGADGSATDGWATLDKTSGQLTYTPAKDQAAGQYYVPVTVTYQDGTSEIVNALVTVTNDAQDYTATGGTVTKGYGEATTAEDVTSQVTTNYPADKADQPTITVDNPAELPDGQTPGDYTVPVTVTYPDGTTDSTTVKVTVLDKVIDVTDDPSKPTPEGYVRVTLAIGEGVDGSGKVYDVKKGEALTADNLPTITAKDGYKNAQWPAAATQAVSESTTFTATATKVADNELNNPSYDNVDVPAGSTATTDPTFTDQDGNKVTPPADTTFAGGEGIPGWATVDGSTGTVTVAPGTDTPSGEYEVPVTVTYPDGSTDTTTVHVTVTNDAADYAAQGDELTKGYGEPTTTDDVTSQVTTNYPADKADQPAITVDNPAELPDGQTPGNYTIPVTVTYPDGTKDTTTVTVTVLDKIIDVTNDPSKPTPEGYVRVTLAIGEGVDGNGKVYDVKKGEALTADNLPTITAKDGYKDAQWPAAATQPVSETSTFTATATKITDAETNTPAYDDVNVPAGSTATTDPTFTDQDGNKVTPPAGTTFTGGEGTPDWATVDGSTGTVTVAPSTETPSGDYTVPVEVKYPDGSTDTVDVHVTITNDAADYTAQGGELTKGYGEPTTADDVTSQVTTNYPADKADQPAINVDDPSTLPDGQTPGDYIIPVTVTYPDGTKDTTTVTVTVLDKVIDVTDDPSKPTPEGYVRVTLAIGDGVDGNGKVYDVKKGEALTADNLPAITAKDGYKDAQWPAAATQPVSETSTFTATATKITDAETNTPAYDDVNVPAGTTATTDPTFTDQDGNKVTPPADTTFTGGDNNPDWAKVDGSTGTVTVAPGTDTPSGDYTVSVEVNYPDGSTDTVDVHVTITNDAADYTAQGGTVTKGYGEPTTADDVTSQVMTNYPADKAAQPTITVDNPAGLPDGKTAGNYTIPVTVTYPDGTKDTTTVKVTVLDKVIDVTDDPSKPTPEGYVRVTLAIGEGVDGSGKIYDVKKGEALTADNLPAITAKDGYKDAQWPAAATQAVSESTTFTATATKVADNELNNPSYDDVNVPAGSTATTDPTFTDQDGNKVTPPADTTFTGGKNNPDWAKVDGSTGTVTVAPETDTPSGDYTVSVEVNYPDGSIDTVDVHVTITNDAADYTAQGGTVTKGYGEPTTADDVTSQVTTNYPADKAAQPAINVDDPSTLPDGKTAGDYTIPVTVTYPDGTKDTATVTVTILDKVIDVTNDPSKPTPEGYVRVSFEAGDHGSFAAGTSTVFDVKKGTTASELPVPTVTAAKGYNHEGWNPALPTNVDASATYVAQYEATKPAGKPIIVDPGQQPDPSDGISNKDDLPDGTSFEWKDPVDTSTTGKQDGTIVVTYPDGAQAEVTVTITVNGDASANDDAQTPEEEPAAEETTVTPAKENPAASHSNNAAKQTLPQTGNANEAGIVALGAATAFFALFGLAKRKKNNED